MSEFPKNVSVTKFTNQIMEKYPKTKNIYVIFILEEVSTPDKFDKIKIDPLGVVLYSSDGTSERRESEIRTVTLTYKQLFDIFSDRIRITLGEEKKGKMTKTKIQTMVINTTPKTFKNNQYHPIDFSDASKSSALGNEVPKNKSLIEKLKPIKKEVVDEVMSKYKHKSLDELDIDFSD